MSEYDPMPESEPLSAEVLRRLRAQRPVAFRCCDAADLDRLRAENLRLKAALAEASADDEVRW